MTTFDDIKDWTYGTVKEVKEGEKKIVLETGEGALFSAPVNGYYIEVWPIGKLPLIKPAIGSGERVEAFRIESGGLTGDTFTWTSRKQLGTEEREIKVGDQVAAPLSAEVIEAIQTAVNARVASAKAPLELKGGGAEVALKSEGITNEFLGPEAVTNPKVKKESLEPNRLEKEKLVSEQVKLHGLTIDRLKEGEITGAYIKNESIEESKLVLTNVVFITGEQTVTGKKIFAPPALPTEAIEKGVAGIEAIQIKARAGQSVSKTEGFSQGGRGGNTGFEAGPGGNAKSKGEAAGGQGGEGFLFGGTGGSAILTNGENNVGGMGGRQEIFGGAGGTAAGSGTGKRQGGEGGINSVFGGEGGPASGGTSGKAGAGGLLILGGGLGGPGEEGRESGDGGVARLIGGKAGEGEGTPKGGAAEVVGGVASTDALSGPIIFKTGKGSTERLKITSEGVIEAKGEIKAEAKVKVKELLTASGGLTVEGALTLPSESITAPFLKAESVIATKLASNAVETAKIKNEAVTKEKLSKSVQEELEHISPVLVHRTSSTNIAKLEGEATIDGAKLKAGQLVLLFGQTEAVQNGIWEGHGAGAWTRPTVFSSGAKFTRILIQVLEGNVFKETFFFLTNTTEVTVETTKLKFRVFAPLPKGSAAGELLKRTATEGIYESSNELAELRITNALIINSTAGLLLRESNVLVKGGLAPLTLKTANSAYVEVSCREAEVAELTALHEVGGVTSPAAGSIIFLEVKPLEGSTVTFVNKEIAEEGHGMFDMLGGHNLEIKEPSIIAFLIDLEHNCKQVFPLVIAGEGLEFNSKGQLLVSNYSTFLKKENNLAELSNTGTAKLNLNISALNCTYAVATTNITLEGEQTIDGVAVKEGQFVLAAGQTEAKNNGVWEVKTGKWVRGSIFPEGGKINKNTMRFLPVLKGTLYKNTWWALENLGEEVTIGTTNQTWELLGVGPEVITAEKLATNSVTEAKIKSEAVTAAKLATNAVETAKIKNEAVTKEKLSKSVQEEIRPKKLSEGIVEGHSEAPTIAAGTGAGTGATVTIEGTDVGGKVKVTTGANPISNAEILGIKFHTAYSTAPFAVISPATRLTANVESGVEHTPFLEVSTTEVKIIGNKQTLQPMTVYEWFYSVTS